MNNSLKILLTIDLIGVMGPVQDKVEVIPYSYSTDFDGKPITEVRGCVKHKNRDIKPCSQNIKLSQDSYDLFVSGEVPYWSKDFIWQKLTKIERVKAHCARIADDKNFTFEILDN